MEAKITDPVAEHRQHRAKAEIARAQLRALYPAAVARLGKLVAHKDPAVALKACAMVLDRVAGERPVELVPTVPYELRSYVDQLEKAELLGEEEESEGEEGEAS